MASHWTAALSVVASGAHALPSWTAPAQWTPASVYAALQSILKLTVLSGPLLFFIDAPFGKFGLPTSPLRLPGRLAFALMELPAPVTFALSMATPALLTHDSTLARAGWFSALIAPSWQHLRSLPVANLVLGALFVIHYTYRAIIQPLLGPPRSPSHVSVFFSAFLFSIANGFTLGAWIGGRSPALLVPATLLSSAAAAKSLHPAKSASWLAGILPRSKAAPPGTSTALPVAKAGLLPAGFNTLTHPLFVLGVLGWAVGFAANAYHDEILFNIRRRSIAKQKQEKHKGSGSSDDSPTRYEVPQGGLYSLISYPNYFCEWFEWFSFALAALSQCPLSALSPSGSVPLTLAGRVALMLTAPPLLFAVVEVCVMLPRAVRGHEWYKAKFGVEGDGKQGRYPASRKAVLPFIL